MLTPYLPYPPASGGQIRTLYLLKYLSQNHQITLVSLYKNDKEKEYAQNLYSFCQKIYLCKRAEQPWQLGIIIRSIISLLPFLIVRNFSQEAKEIIKKLLTEEKFDVIHAETFYIMPHLPNTNIPVLLVEQTIEFKVYQHFISKLNFFTQLALSIDILKIKYWEMFYWKKAALVATVSQADKETIEKIETKIKPVVIPNGAGDEMFVDQLPEKKLSTPVLLFVGNFYWLQNVEAAKYLLQQIFPLLIKSIPNATLTIAGQNVIQKLGKCQNKYIKIINISVDNQELVKKLYKQSTVFIAPIFGPGGTRLKILAAMAAGLPVVATRTGLAGLEVTDGQHALIAENPADFTAKISSILTNPSLYRSIQKNAYNLVKTTYSWPSIAKKLEIAYKQITNS